MLKPGKISKKTKLFKNLQTDISMCYSGNSIIVILQNLSKLFEEKNAIVMTDSVLYLLAIDEFKQGLVLRVGRLFDDDKRSDSVLSLVRSLRRKNKQDLSDNINRAICEIEKLACSEQVKANLVFRNKMYAHVDKDRKKVLEDLVITLDDYNYIFNKLIKMLNIFNRELFDNGTFAGRYSGDDLTLNEMRWLERAKASRIYLERQDSTHPAMEYKIGT
jgi:hypothetical protein